MSRYKVGLFVIVRPYSNPEGKLARVSEIANGRIRMEYLDGIDKFGRREVTSEVDDNTLEIIGEDSIESVELLFGAHNDSRSVDGRKEKTTSRKRRVRSKKLPSRNYS